MNCLYCNNEIWEQSDACHFCGKPQPLYEGPEGYDWNPSSGFYYRDHGAVRILFDPISGKYTNEPTPNQDYSEYGAAYAPPEGFLFDEESGWYKQEAISTDKSGARHLLTIWFDPETGGYEQKKRLLKQNTGSNESKAGHRKQKRLPVVTAALLMIIGGVAVSQIMGWIELPFIPLFPTDSASTPNEAEADPVGNTAEAVGRLRDDDDAPWDSAEDTPMADIEEFSSTEQPVRQSERMLEGSTEAVQIISSSSPSPVISATARAENEDLIVAYEIAEEYWECGSFHSIYGTGGGVVYGYDQEFDEYEAQLAIDRMVESILGDLEGELELPSHYFGTRYGDIRHPWESIDYELALWEEHGIDYTSVFICGLTLFDYEYEYVGHAIFEVDFTKV